MFLPSMVLYVGASTIQTADRICPNINHFSVPLLWFGEFVNLFFTFSIRYRYLHSTNTYLNEIMDHSRVHNMSHEVWVKDG